MKQENAPHPTTISFGSDLPSEVDAGTALGLQARVSCVHGCNLVGKILKIVREDTTALKEIPLVRWEGGVNETDEFTLESPTQPGMHPWVILFPAQEDEGITHTECSNQFQITVTAHKPSIAVWDIPSPVVMDKPFTVKVGVKCSADCNLADKFIEIYDERRERVSRGKLGDTPWEHTEALYWAEVELHAPGVEEYYEWRVKFPQQEFAMPHEAASSAFGFRTTRAAECKVTISVLGINTGTPVANAYVILGAYKAYTDQNGVAQFEVPKGGHPLSVFQVGYETLKLDIQVGNDATIKAELVTAIPVF